MNSSDIRNILNQLQIQESDTEEEIDENNEEETEKAELEEEELTEEEQIKNHIRTLVDESDNINDFVTKVYEMFDDTLNESDWAKKTMARVKRATGTGMGSTDLSQSGKTWKPPTATVPDNATAPGMAKAPAFLRKTWKPGLAKAPGMAKAPRPKPL